MAEGSGEANANRTGTAVPKKGKSRCAFGGEHAPGVKHKVEVVAGAIVGVREAKAPADGEHIRSVWTARRLMASRMHLPMPDDADGSGNQGHVASALMVEMLFLHPLFVGSSSPAPLLVPPESPALLSSLLLLLPPFRPQNHALTRRPRRPRDLSLVLGEPPITPLTPAITR
ncbi:uncharacterized protein LAESUDRAFT_757626 [Laetiporus sulphureus 93-53]|uniref:Uncharacterized protein n=1 Tax=Laetiporus sulphureus 93-53 TaxID=1314785 RepID=A0A165F4T6_9APHY|nr:uncharacterized protein LAESUDRAFT_757626 [Laetiporus sulphureus 93-53]KZT08389.1 hypothetical protein LAESUDRAFT_757626 [Laetiporus sulphureus 93-53]